MASRFVSAGVMVAATGEATQNDPPTTTTTDTTTTTTTTTKTTSGSKKKAEWVAVTAQLESERRQREAARLHQQQQQGGSQQPEKSLYEVLQANKAAKQAAFEEAHRLRNQFRALEEDEVQFLEEVRERKRREEEEARREVERGLQAFKEAQRKGVAAGGWEEEKDEGGGW
ncbi:hypothetical protein N657DRAFT_669837 [Parathielavia appendiculata]|uniref:FAM192A/Fyv6 N-terminal domain-containing protein n=1 Tax=Parathielavia appendiculata TaxID=2587402 RepID=A0AAN6U487_9PEZI|nr:hypothetical protein N657DRAFT_669837 [Parathielavia appendiculata]